MVPAEVDEDAKESPYHATMNESFNAHDGVRPQKYDTDDKVYTTIYERNKMKWIAGTIKEKLGETMYRVEAGSKIHVRHANQLKTRYIEDEQSSRTTWSDFGLNLALSLLLSAGLRKSLLDRTIRPEESDEEEDRSESPGDETEDMSIQEAIEEDDDDIREISKLFEAVKSVPLQNIQTATHEDPNCTSLHAPGRFPTRNRQPPERLDVTHTKDQRYRGQR